MSSYDLSGANFLTRIRDRAVTQAKENISKKLNINLNPSSPVMTTIDPNKPLTDSGSSGSGKLFLYGGIALGGLIALKIFSKKKN